MPGRVLDTITPESETTCMYFGSLTSNYKLREQSLTTQLREANAKVFAEDQAVVEVARQHALESYATRAIQNHNIDAGSMRARRTIEDVIEAEGCNADALGS